MAKCQYNCLWWSNNSYRYKYCGPEWKMSLQLHIYLKCRIHFFSVDFTDFNKNEEFNTNLIVSVALRHYLPLVFETDRRPNDSRVGHQLSVIGFSDSNFSVSVAPFPV